jgi:hypothetical protein
MARSTDLAVLSRVAEHRQGPFTRAPNSWMIGEGEGDHCLGRSRGGLSAKIHIIVDAQVLPARLGLKSGQVHDGQIADTQ